MTVTHTDSGWFFFSKGSDLFLIEVEKNSQTSGLFDSYQFFYTKEEALDHIKYIDSDWVYEGDEL